MISRTSLVYAVALLILRLRVLLLPGEHCEHCVGDGPEEPSVTSLEDGGPKQLSSCSCRPGCAAHLLQHVLCGRPLPFKPGWRKHPQPLMQSVASGVLGKPSPSSHDCGSCPNGLVKFSQLTLAHWVPAVKEKLPSNSSVMLSSYRKYSTIRSQIGAKHGEKDPACNGA
jgi:hypothetical protein